MASSTNPVSSQILTSLFHHVALPPRLPAKHDNHLEVVEKALAERFYRAASSLRNATNQPAWDQWNWVSRTLSSSNSLHAGGKLNGTALLHEFGRLEPGGLLIAYIAAQNAGILIRRHRSDQIEFEVFEASPRAEDVLASQAALKWDFPGSAVSVPWATFHDYELQKHLAIFLEQASQECIKDFAPTTMKAGSRAFESRDSVDPTLISSMLTTLLEVNGHRLSPVLLRKRVRDDVCWSDGAEMPWRRCPFYLVLRVAVQRYLCVLFEPVVARMHYKMFMCLFMTRLCDDLRISNVLVPEDLAFIRTKIARRAVKLHTDLQRSPVAVRQSFEKIHFHCRKEVEKSLRAVNDQISQKWQAFKHHFKRRVPHLPQVASPGSLTLSLKNSGNILNTTLKEGRNLYVTKAYTFHEATPLTPVGHSPPPRNTELERYLRLADTEWNVEKDFKDWTKNLDASESQCVDLARTIIDYSRRAAGPYDGSPEQKSTMLLTLMELWICVDRCTTSLIPLLKDYDPGFPNDVLNPLQVMKYSDMNRLRRVESYLRERGRQSRNGLPSLFSDPVEGCFAERYFDESAVSVTLQEKLQSIIEAADASRLQKEQEWLEKHAEYEDLLRVVNESACLFTIDEDQPLARVHDPRCRRCYHERCARRIRIQIHEYPLPIDRTSVKAIITESELPEYFHAYRYSTWLVLRDLARRNQVADHGAEVLIHEYSELRAYFPRPKYPICLGSRTKSFLSSHYASVRLPVPLKKVCLPNGLNLGLFDGEKGLWTARQRQLPSFGSHCRYTLPRSSPLASMQFSSSFDTDGNNRTPNQIVSSQSKCPSGVSVQEFIGFQDLLCGTHVLWLKLLRELGSSNLNFSAEAVAALATRAALKAGQSWNNDLLRVTHWTMKDELFCKVILEQLNLRLDAISTNWRETVSLESLVTLGLRIWSLAHAGPAVRAAEEFLHRIRAIALDWMNSLQSEMFESQDAQTSQKRSRDAFWAAAVCRKTFIMDAQSEDALLSAKDLQVFVDSSIVLKNNTGSNLSSLPQRTRNALVWDHKLAYGMLAKIRRSIEVRPSDFGYVINKAWPEGASSRAFTPWLFLDGADQYWVTSTTIPPSGSISQRVLYNVIDGSMLVNGQPLGQLPDEHRKSDLFKDIFGDRNVSTYPSDLQGMTYVVARPVNGHRVHFGVQRGRLFIRVCDTKRRGRVMQLMDPVIFHSESDFDLPTPLIAKSAHWLDFSSGIVEIRKRGSMWKAKNCDWHLDVLRCRAHRRGSTLLNPLSSEFNQFGKIFDYFETRNNLLIYQPSESNTRVDLPLLELSFVVSRAGHLFSPQLRATIDHDQDAGTLYGLNSKLLLRDVANREQRSIIVPLGNVRVARNQFHVSVTISPSGDYAKLPLNVALGRVESPAEPRIWYMKALLHACTSFLFPDSLTGRTGTEEALVCLRSGYCQPWAPLGPGSHQLLSNIAELTPRREYYPKDMKVMQKTFWDPNLTITIQHDDFQEVAEHIVHQAHELETFHAKRIEARPLPARGAPHLLRRASFRNHNYQRKPMQSLETAATSDQQYEPRDSCSDDLKRSNVFESVSLIKQWPQHLPVTKDLPGVLQGWPSIGGFGKSCNRILISDLLHIDFAEEWGSLCTYCRNVRGEAQKYEVMFFFSTMSFRTNVDLEILGTLIAYAVSLELKQLETPEWPLYIQFRYEQVPSLEHLLKLIQPFRTPYAGEERHNPLVSTDAKQRKRLRDVENEHNQQSQEDCKAIAQFLLSQWPNVELTMNGFERVVLVNINEALDVIRPEWERLVQNFQLSDYTTSVQRALNRCCCEHTYEMDSVITSDQILLPPDRPLHEVPSLKQLLLSSGPNESENWRSLSTSEFPSAPQI